MSNQTAKGHVLPGANAVERPEAVNRHAEIQDNWMSGLNAKLDLSFAN